VCPCDQYNSFTPARPALAETTTWVTAAGGWERAPSGRPSGSLGLVGVGAETTFGPVLRWRGFPAGGRWQRDFDREAELRVGAWASGATRLEGGLLEGGATVHLGAVNHAEWGSFDARAGGGYGTIEAARSPYVVVALAWGTRSFQERYGDCGPVHGSGSPPAHGFGSVLRPVLTVRRSLDGLAVTQLTVGIELSPTFLLPPYSWWRLAGGPSD
jgi:hypothetical protein